MVKFAVEFWWKMLLTIFPSKRSSKISFQTSPEVRHHFRRKLRQLHSGNRCLPFWGVLKKPTIKGTHDRVFTGLVPNVVTGKSLDSPEKGNVDKMSEKCRKNVRNMSKNCPEGPTTQFSDIFWTIFAYLVDAFVW